MSDTTVNYKHTAESILESEELQFVSLAEKNSITKHTKDIDELKNRKLLIDTIPTPDIKNIFWIEEI